jgi:predicted transcriptional regulator
MPRRGTSERKTYSVRLQESVLDSLRHLAVDEHRPLSGLLEEAITDILAKYARTTPPGSGKEEGAKRGRRDKAERRTGAG